ncbi:MAG TPA: hypothetical protein VK436_03175 [Methanocella sp.]|nr:hypothetical protein [Methanocella sp.]
MIKPDAAIAAIDELLSDLQRVEAEVNMVNADLLNQVSDWEDRLDQRYKDVTDRINTEFAALEARSTELNATDWTSVGEIRKISESAIEEVRMMSEDLKMAHETFNSSVNDKLAKDQENIERIKYNYEADERYDQELIGRSTHK